MANLGQLFGVNLDDMEEEESVPLPTAEAQIDEMKILYRSYANRCQFKPGDLVTPRKNSTVRGAGMPHLVLEVRPKEEAQINTNREAAHSNQFGQRLDFRVITYTDRGTIAAYWCESWMFEPFKA